MNTTIKLLAIVLGSTLIATSCKKSDPTPAATVYYQQQDQFGRPAINTVFNGSSDKDAFNTTAPSAMGAIFQPKFLANVVALDGFLKSKNAAYVNYSTNALGWDPVTLTTALSTDVLNVTTTGTPTLATLTGRTLADDAIDIELKFVVFGGPTGASNPQLTSDHVDANDKPFLASFPYLAAPF
ncbi:MAG: DUF4331 family protein [Chitinophagaceae bacterium]|nr:DUF4331 family protein [Chitinophagaceae bacterium]MBK8787435.1 DUF4331 family protein [Chitinophagaceae bacterium]MBK9485939.1 DUF4331 family protein [Chitinophagaceae bacterium]MBL0201405.1 DUF4331 family protein [Chitinophagaceae bacterium]